MTKISFQVKNNLIVKYKDGKYFSKDLELFKKHCPGHTLNNELAKANKFSFARLDGLMLAVLLDVLPIEDILENRIKEQEPEPEPRTVDEIKALLILQFGLDEKDLDGLSEIIPLWLDKTDEEIISAVKKLLGEGSKDSEGSEEGDQGKTDDKKSEATNTDNQNSETIGSGGTSTLQPVERGNVKIFQQRIADAETTDAVEAIMKEDKDGGERSTVQQAGLKRIEILKVAQENSDDKKKIKVRRIPRNRLD